MSDIKPTVNVRIKHKYDTYENWITSSLILEAGELAIAKIKNGDNQLTPPTIGIKVGDGEKTFSQLDWIQAIAGDVNSWAKESAPQNLFGKSENTYNYPQFISELKTFISGNVNDTTYRFNWANDILEIYQQVPTPDNSDFTENLITTIDLTHKANRLDVSDDYSGGNILTLSKKSVDAEGNPIAGTGGDIEDSGVKLNDLASKADLNTIAKDVSDNKATLTMLTGTGDGSIHQTVSTAITNLVDGAPEALNTLGEIVDYITNTNQDGGVDGALTLIEQVEKNKEDINKNAVAIASLQTTVGDETNGLVKDVAESKSIITEIQNIVNNEESGLVSSISKLQTTVGDETKGLVKDVADLTSELNNTANLASTAIQDIVISNSVPSKETSYVTETTTQTGITASINAIPVHLLTNSTIDSFYLVFDCGNANGFTSNNS